MNTPQKKWKPKAVFVAINCALLGNGIVRAQSEPTLADLVQPKNVLEIGVDTVNNYTAKSNEFNGRKNGNPFPFLNLEIRSAVPEGDDATRWSLAGNRLGSQSGSADFIYGVQGRYRATLGFSDLLRNQSDSYQTPYSGVGSNVFTLPANWVPVVVPRVNATAPNVRGLSPAVTSSNALISGVSTPPTAAQLVAASAMQAADLSAFSVVELFTKRTRYSAAWEQELSPQWSWKASGSLEHKSGFKPLGAQSRAVGGDSSSILPTPIDQDDNQFHLGLNYTSDAFQIQAAYDDSTFTNNIPSTTWNLWGAPQVFATAATAPSNRFRKLSLSGNYRFSDSTSLTGSASQARNTQNDAFLKDATALLVPTESANALVVNESATLRLAHRATSRLNLSASYKYDLRDNRTPVSIFGYYDNNNAPTGTSPFAYLYPDLKGLGQNFNFNANTPYSKRVNQIHLDAAYRLQGSHNVKVGFDSQQTDRFCTGSWINCADAIESTEHTARAEWRGELAEDFSARVSVSSARRTVVYDENAFLAVVPMAGKSPSTATGAISGTTVAGVLQALGLTGYGPVSGLNPVAPAGSALAFYFANNNALNNLLYANENRISELVGMRRYNQADRNRDKLRSSLTWQVNEKLSLQASGDLSSDHYAKSVYGLQRVTIQSVNLDATYVASDSVNVSVFGSLENQRSRSAGNTYTANSTATNVNGATAISGGCFATIALRNANYKIDPCLDWTANTRDLSTTIGITASMKKLLARKLDLEGSAMYSDGRTDIDVSGGSYVNNPFAGITGAASKDIAAFYVPATPLPTNRVKSISAQLVGTYWIAPQHGFRLAYGFQRLRSSDWGIEGLQAGESTQVLPTFEKAPNFNVHRFGMSYLATF